MDGNLSDDNIIKIRKTGISKDEFLKSLIRLEKRVTPPLSENGIDIKSYAEKLLKFSEIIAIENSEGICGIISIYVNNTDNGFAYITFIAVDENIAGKGYGCILLEEAEKKAVSAGLSQIRLEVNNINTPARRFYQKMGYVESGTASEHSVYMTKRKRKLHKNTKG